MIVDTSALIAILAQEPDAAEVTRVLLATPDARLSAVSYVESCMVAEGRFGLSTDSVDRLIDRTRVAIAPVTAAQARLAAEAFRRFGKGQHAARLNLGDCFAYALAKTEDAPLLFKSGDFAKTDVRRAR